MALPENLEEIIEAIAWSNARLHSASLEKDRLKLKKELEHLSKANARIRNAVGASFEALPEALKLEIRVVEMGFNRLDARLKARRML